MRGFIDTCADADMVARLEPIPPRAEPVVFIRQKQPAGADHLRKVKAFYKEMSSRAAAIRSERNEI